MSAATLLLIRHGETAWNAAGRIQGQLDVPLSATGLWQAQRLAQRLAAEPLAALYASDLTRAALTAQPLAQAHGLPVRYDARLRERHFGVFQGLTAEEVAARHPAEFAAWRARDPHWVVPGGESGAQLITRALAALADIAQRHVGQTVAVVAHGGVLDAAYRHARALPWQAPREHPIANAAINRVQASDAPLRLQIVQWGDVAHLAATRDELADV
ncbi:MAG: histidine phosphatase family protein [Burkholderiaceae bacterium]|nr:histidine phosphatase family protein [Burkholderiaceae bacterium]